jgi:uncharacterized Fe-S cluster protein YjdI
MSQKPSADREELAISHARPYSAPGVRVFYDRGRCLHFAECVRGLPQVFDVEKRPWIQPGNASAEQVALATALGEQPPAGGDQPPVRGRR